MKIYSVYDPEFTEYGRIVDGVEVGEIVEALNKYTPLPEDGTCYIPEVAELQELPASKKLAPTLFGGQPVQFGCCNGHNTKLNCLEYHRNSEFNLGTQDFILILGRQCDMKDWKLDTATCKAFKAPAGVLVEVYATSLHFAPCHADSAKGFRVLIGLPQGTNTKMPEVEGKCSEDRLLFARNKWLLAHPEASQASQGAWIGLVGENIDIAGDI